MKHIKWVLLSALILLVSFNSSHKFYLSVSEVTYSEDDHKIRLLTRLFIDDLDEVLMARYDIDSKLTTEFEHEMADFYLAKYLHSKLLLKINNQVIELKLLGKKVDNDQLVFFFEAPYNDIEQLSSIFIQNELLMDRFEDQQNIVHYKIKGQKKSSMLIKERPSSLLNF